jgi:aspartyl-tRNA(Asn)/glutamyl-tRNA(Gln) amidotransferase subunit A
MSATNLLDLTAAAAARALDSREIAAAELFDAYADRARKDSLNCFTWVAEGTPPAPPSGAPLAGVPLAVKDLFCTENVPSQSGSRILEG